MLFQGRVESKPKIPKVQLPVPNHTRPENEAVFRAAVPTREPAVQLWLTGTHGNSDSLPWKKLFSTEWTPQSQVESSTLNCSAECEGQIEVLLGITSFVFQNVGLSKDLPRSLLIHTQLFWNLWWLLKELNCKIKKQADKHQSLSHVWFFATPWTVARQAPRIHGNLQARMLEWVAIPFSGGSSQPRNWTQNSCIAGRFPTVWATRDAP